MAKRKAKAKSNGQTNGEFKAGVNIYLPDAKPLSRPEPDNLIDPNYVRGCDGFGERLRNLFGPHWDARNNPGILAETLADLMEVPAETAQAWLDGFEWPNLAQGLRLADICRCHPRWLAFGVDTSIVPKGKV